MTSKERASFRAQANSLDPLFQVGKGGVSQGVIDQTREAFETKELIKLKVLLDTCPETPREIADKLAECTACDVIQVIGGVMVLYKYNPELHKEEKKKPAKKVSVRKTAAKGKTYGRNSKAPEEKKPFRGGGKATMGRNFGKGR